MAREATVDSLYELLGRREFAAWVSQQRADEGVAQLQSRIAFLEQQLAALPPAEAVSPEIEKANGSQPSRR